MRSICPRRSFRRRRFAPGGANPSYSNGLEAVIPWKRFRTSVEEAEALARPEKFDAYQELGEHHAGVRR